MVIKERLAYQFMAIVGVILIISFFIIHLAFAQYREDDFFERLERKANSVAQLLIDIDEVDASLLQKIEKNTQLNLPHEEVSIFNSSNKLIYKTESSTSLEISIKLINEVKTEGKAHYRFNEFEVVGLLYKGKMDNIVVFVGATDIYGKNKIYNLGFILFTVFVFSIVIIFISGKIFSSRALSPISRLITQLNTIDVNQLDQRVAEGNGKDEIASLAIAFNKMLSKLEGSFKIQKNFIANASHELRTPLTIISGQIEVELMNERSADEYKQRLQSVLEDVLALNTSTNRLLLLAKASSDFATSDFSNIRIDDSLWIAVSEVTKRNKAYKVDAGFDESIEEEDNLTIWGNDQLLKTLFVNLIDNSCKYSPNHTSTIAIASEENAIVFSFSDNGIGIPEDELNMIFQPFYRAKNASLHKGHGLGLSLVEKISHLHNGSLKVQSVINEGTTFVVSFPTYLPQ